MDYKISYDMAIELLRSYLEKIYLLDKHRGTSPIKVQQLYDLNSELRSLIQQLQEDGHNTDEIIRTLKEKLEKKYTYQKLNVYVDGAARGNNDPSIPNISGIGFVVIGDSQMLYKGSRYLGSEIILPHLRHQSPETPNEVAAATNNTAEYIALIEALEYLLANELTASQIEIFSDSTMVVQQVTMTSTTKAPHLIRLRCCAQQLLDEFDNIVLTHIPREYNTVADGLVNELLDQHEAQNEANAG